MTLQIGDTAPAFEAQSTETRLDRRFLSPTVLAPEGLTPLCTTEFGYMAKLKPDRRNVTIIGLSVDPVDQHSSGGRH